MSPEEMQAQATLLGLTPAQQMMVTWAFFGTKLLGEIYSSIRAGGGLRRILMSIWLGEQLPKVVADDYKAELNPKDSK